MLSLDPLAEVEGWFIQCTKQPPRPWLRGLLCWYWVPRMRAGRLDGGRNARSFSFRGCGLGVAVAGDHGLLVEGQLAGEHLVNLATFDLLHPGADQHGGHGVAGEVGQGAGLGHEAVDSDDHADAAEQFRLVGLRRPWRR